MMKQIFQKLENLSNKYRILYWIRLAIFIAMAFCTFKFIHTIFFKKGTQVINTTLAPVDSYRDKYNNLRSEFAVQQMSDKEEFKRITDSLKKVLKGRPAIKSVTTTASESNVIIKEVPVYVDTANNPDSLFLIKENNYISLYASISTKTNLGEVVLRSYDTTTTIVYDKKRFLKSNIRYVNISNKNPYNTIVSGNAVELKEQKVLAVFGPSIQYDLINRRFGAGISFTMNLIPIKTRK